MNQNKNSSHLDVLDQIKKVEAPPFLFTRIKEKIEASSLNRFSLSASWSLAISFTLVLVLNIVVLLKNTTDTNKDVSIVQTMDLLPHNSIYK